MAVLSVGYFRKFILRVPIKKYVVIRLIYLQQKQTNNWPYFYKELGETLARVACPARPAALPFLTPAIAF